MIFVFPSVKDNLFSGYLGVDQGPLPHLMQMLGPAPPLQPTSCPTSQFLLSPSVSCPSPTWGPCGTTPSPGLKGSAVAAPFPKAERRDSFPDFSHPVPLQEQMGLFSSPKSTVPPSALPS